MLAAERHAVERSLRALHSGQGGALRLSERRSRSGQPWPGARLKASSEQTGVSAQRRQQQPSLQAQRRVCAVIWTDACTDRTPRAHGMKCWGSISPSPAALPSQAATAAAVASQAAAARAHQSATLAMLRGAPSPAARRLPQERPAVSSALPLTLVAGPCRGQLAMQRVKLPRYKVARLIVPHAP